jgi:hypothetical protein
LSKKRWNYKRLSTCSKPVNGDVLVFRCIQDSSFLIKRCVGIPDDSLIIKNNIWYCNEEKYNYSNTIVYDFVVREDNKKLEQNNLLQYLDLSHNIDIEISKWFNFKIPKKGDTICLNNENFKFYAPFITQYEQKKVLKKIHIFL